MMNILSIDWDYFFPDAFPYDWGHAEKVFYLETIWPIRLTNHNLSTGKEAFTEYVPTIPRNFWKQVVARHTPIYVAESHASISSIPFRKAVVTNLDAHHDAGYSDYPELECGNWAWYMKDRIPEYHLCYPTWRQNNSEGKMKRTPDSITYGLPKLADYDLIFVCRSGCWTPPWWDAKFNSWLRQSGMIVTRIDDYVKKTRRPNMKQAVIEKTRLEEQFREMKKQNPQLVF